MTVRACKVLVIGGGPGGYVAAIRAGQAGLDTVLVEEKRPGGTCLNVGCIPSKALIHAADEFAVMASGGAPNALGLSCGPASIDLARTMAWKDGIVDRLTGGVSALLRKAKVTVITGTASFRDGRTVEVATPDGPLTIKPENTVIATGSEPVEIASLPFGGRILSSTTALELTAVPETLAVVGGGYIGLELGTAYAKLGARVTVVEAAERILPVYDADLTAPVARRLADLGVRVLTGARAGGFSEAGLQVTLSDGTSETIPVDRLLVTAGRRPRTAGLGIEDLGVDRQGPFIRIDDRCRTSMRGIYAIGDVTGEPMLAHRAMAQGELVAAVIVGENRVWDNTCIPAICFTDPEVVTAGLDPAAAKAAGFDAIAESFPLKANGRAMTMEREDGFIRVVARRDTHLILGIQAVGAGVSELAAAFALAIETGCRLEDLAGTIHAHPTKGEVLQEAALKALGHALHI